MTAPGIPPAIPSASDNTVASVVITPASVSGNLGETGQFTATARNAAGTILSGRAFTWASTDPTIVAVSPAGLVSAVGVGVTTITASTTGITGQTQVTVAGDPVSTIAVAPSQMNGKIGQVTQFRATL
ncbi:MAG TPA: Ig-like domain-containing protein, partial [Gemmatimonadaceae bacterium]|nr:Ig-like domain-containing protein [Gemmatimonadaceae bacterium]